MKVATRNSRKVPESRTHQGLRRTSSRLVAFLAEELRDQASARRAFQVAFEEHARDKSVAIREFDLNLIRVRLDFENDEAILEHEFMEEGEERVPLAVFRAAIGKFECP